MTIPFNKLPCHQTSFEEAFDTIFKLDLTHVLAKGHCQNAYNKFTKTWKTFQKKDTRVSFLVLFISYETTIPKNKVLCPKNELI